MNIPIVLSIVVIFVSIVNSTSSNNDIEDQEWIKFKTEFNKTYENEKEELFRKKVFLENLKLINKHNELFKKGLKPYELGINTYSDLTHQEFVTRMNGFKRINEKKIHGVRFSIPENVKVPDAIDYRTKGYVTPVKNQGSCASGWAFSATGAIEGQVYRATKKLIPLSVQNLIDCSSSYGNNGCKGGTADNAFRYVITEGVAGENSYPYEAREGTCRHDLNRTAAVSGRGFMAVPPDETALKTAVGSLGPVSATVDVASDDFRAYKSGVYRCGPAANGSSSHAVLVVGYGTDALLGRGAYWIVKNSWGRTWGDHGYALVARDADDRCGIAGTASVPLL